MSLWTKLNFNHNLNLIFYPKKKKKKKKLLNQNTMSKSLLLVFVFNLSVCYLCSASYFHFDRIVIEFAKSLNNGFYLNFYLHPLRYINWIIPLCTAVLICFIRPFRFSLHQGFIYNVICLFFMNVLFYSLEFFFLTNGSHNLDSVLTKLWILQIIHSFILSAIFWINFSSLIANFQEKDVLLVVSVFKFDAFTINRFLNQDY